MQQFQHGRIMLRGNAGQRIPLPDGMYLHGLRHDDRLPGREPVRLVQLVLLYQQLERRMVGLRDAIQGIPPAEQHGSP